MEKSTSARPSLGNIKRKSVSTAQTEWVKTGMLLPDKSMPLLVQPTVDGINLKEWGKANRAFIEENLLKYGAVLFRGFDIKEIAEFEEIIGVMSDSGAIEYTFRASPRSRVAGHVYTSTDYPADQPIFPHNEHSYSPTFPLRLFFFCVIPAEEGGETPLGDCRRIFKRIPTEIVERFKQKRIMYVRNYADGFGLPWRTVFQTEDRAEVETYCRERGITAEWISAEHLRTRQTGPAVVQHPKTGESCWFNHGTFFHITTLPPSLRDGMLAQFKEEDLPTQTYYGDGSPIEHDILDVLRDCYRQEMVSFPWQKGDFVAVDNMLAVHARNPYKGVRKTVVGMAEPTTWKDVQIGN